MMRKFGRDMADMAGRAMKGRMTADRMGRAMARAGQAPVGVAPTRANRPVEPEMSYKKGGKVKMSGGSASKRADGIAHKGKTKGKMVKMNKGGYC